MLRRFIGGLLSGTIVSGVCLSVVSVLIGAPVKENEGAERLPVPVTEPAAQTEPRAEEKVTTEAETEPSPEPEPEPATEPEAAPEQPSDAPEADPTVDESGTSETPQAAEVKVPAGSAFDAAKEDTPAELPTEEDAPAQSPLAQTNLPDADTLDPEVSASLAPQSAADSAPEVSFAPDALPDPADAALNSGFTAPSAATAERQSRSEAVSTYLTPKLPDGEDEVTVSTAPADPPAPSVVAEPETVARADISDLGTVVDNKTQDQAIDIVQEPSEPIADVLAEVVAEQDSTNAPQANQSETAKINGEASAPEAAIEQDVAEEGATAEGRAGIDATEAQPVEGSSSQRTGAGTIGNIAQGVITGRLPSVQDRGERDETALALPTVEGDTSAPEASVTTGEVADVADSNRPAIERFAVPFDNEENKPLMSIVLMDDGKSSVGPEAFADFPYPISFAIDVTSPNAAELAAKYREAGMEVLAMTDLPESAAAQDVEVAMRVYLDAVPEAVAVIEGLGSGLQSSREASTQLAPILQDSGHGLIMWPNGFNTAQKLISREGVPALTVFRDFDGDGQGAATIRRFLDQAALRADQEQGGVIMAGRLRPDTISALLLWGLQDRARSVALAPVSAVLLASQD